MVKIFRVIIAISASITILDLAFSLSTGRDPFIFALGYDIFLLVVAFGVSAVLFLRNVFFLRWDHIFPDLQLFFQAIMAFYTRFPDNLTNFFVSFMQLPFAFCDGLLHLIGGKGDLNQKIGVTGVFSGKIFFDLGTVHFEAYIEITGHYYYFIFNLFDVFYVNNYEINPFTFGLYYFTSPLGVDVSLPFLFSLWDWFIQPIIDALRFGLAEMDLEGIVQEIVERF